LFFRAPVTPDEWKKVLSDPNATLTYTPRTKYNHFDDTVATEAIADNDMDHYRLELKNRTAKYGPSPYKCPFADAGITAVARAPEPGYLLGRQRRSYMDKPLRYECWMEQALHNYVTSEHGNSAYGAYRLRIQLKKYSRYREQLQE
jgi:hypothetical protein